MTHPTGAEPTDPLDYLRVEEFLRDLIPARALKSALELGLVDHLVAAQPCSVDELRTRCGLDHAAMRVLLDLLAAGGVVSIDLGGVRLREEFLRVLPYRDLLEAKLDFANIVAPDFVELFTSLLARPADFLREARLFRLFDYGRCFERTPENYERTRRWMRLTTALTRYEAIACLHHCDFSRHRRMLDIGGNSGEFVLQACRRHPGLSGAVFDLPLVCDIGQQHVQADPLGERIHFFRGNAMADALPRGCDLVTFKSFLHDWPDPAATQLLARAADVLEPGGTILIFERTAIDLTVTPPSFSMLPMLLFFRSFRPPTFYTACLQRLGLRDVAVSRIELEMPFHLVTARKPG